MVFYRLKPTVSCQYDGFVAVQVLYFTKSYAIVFTFYGYFTTKIVSCFINFSLNYFTHVVSIVV